MFVVVGAHFSASTVDSFRKILVVAIWSDVAHNASCEQTIGDSILIFVAAIASHLLLTSHQFYCFSNGAMKNQSRFITIRNGS